MDAATPALPTELRCHLEHKLFATLGNPVFRRADGDSMPVMVVSLGEREASIPLASLRREFEIATNSPDAQMLALIAGALDFVSALRPGDPLPSEILTGEASWNPDPVHFQIAATRLRLQLVDWFNAGSGGDRPDLDAESLLQVADDPRIRQQVQEALTRAATTLGLENAAAVLALLELLGRELAYVEALRDRLLRPVRATVAKIEALSRGWRGDASHVETITQVKRLSAIALRQISGRFEELDAHTGEVMSAMRNAESQKAFIRQHRDWLYRSQRAWEPILKRWEAAGTEFDSGTLALVTRTYQFLAPRFMPVTEWLSAARSAGSTRPNRAPRMLW